MAFTPRTEAPSRTDPYYLCTPAMQTQRYGYVVRTGGLNECIVGNQSQDGSALPNCVGYAWGRWFEILGSRPNLSRANADEWYNYSDGYTHRTTNPTLGSVCCFSTQHVCIIEQQVSTTEYITSGSYWTGVRDFVLERLKYVNGTWKRARYSDGSIIPENQQGFQGFIICPVSTVDNVLADVHFVNANLNFNPYTYSYNVGSTAEIDAIFVSKKYSEQTYTVLVNGNEVLPETAFQYHDGSNSVVIYVMRRVDGVIYSTTYNITVQYGAVPTTEDSRLATVTVAGTDFASIFSPVIYDYNYNLQGDYANIHVAMAQTDDTKTGMFITINGTTTGVEAHQADIRFTWNVGVNTIRIQTFYVPVTTTIYTSTYDFVFNSATDNNLILYGLFKDSGRTLQVPIYPDFQSNIVSYTAQEDTAKLWDNYILKDSRTTIIYKFDHQIIYSVAGLNVPARTHILEVIVSGFDYDGITATTNTYTFYVTGMGRGFKNIYATKLI